MTFQKIIVDTLSEISGLFVTVIAGLCVLTFVYGVVKYLYKGDSDSERKKGRDFMLWGIIGLLVFYGVWGIIGILGKTFHFPTVIPQFEGGEDTLKLETGRKKQ